MYQADISIIKVACGAWAEFEPDGLGYRCYSCGKVIGSVGMPSRCATLQREQHEAEEIVRKLKGR
jgi:hypothetical protein